MNTSKVNQIFKGKCILTFLRDKPAGRLRESVVFARWFVVVLPTPSKHLFSTPCSCNDAQLRGWLILTIVSTASAMFAYINWATLGQHRGHSQFNTSIWNKLIGNYVQQLSSLLYLIFQTVYDYSPQQERPLHTYISLSSIQQTSTPTMCDHTYQELLNPLQNI